VFFHGESNELPDWELNRDFGFFDYKPSAQTTELLRQKFHGESKRETNCRVLLTSFYFEVTPGEIKFQICWLMVCH